MEDYKTLLKNAYEKIKPIKTNGERFEVPHVEAHTQGNKTIITNSLQICSKLRRRPEHLLKFLLRELATSGEIKQNRFILNRKIHLKNINEKIELYVQEFVLCKECKKPDTELIKQDRFLFLHCLACGAKHSVRAKIQ